MRVRLESVRPLRFEDGAPVRAASALARLGDGWLVVQDDATHACWWRDEVGTPVRVLPPVEGLDLFSETDHTKHLKPDLEAACEVPGGVLLLGSGSTPARMRAVLVGLVDDDLTSSALDLTQVYADVATALGVAPAALNLEGACVVGDALRWYQRGLPSAGVPTASVDLDLVDLLEVVAGTRDARDVGVGAVRRYDLGVVAGVGLAITDAVTLEGGVLAALAAEDAPDAYADGPVVASAIALLPDDAEPDVVTLPTVRGTVAKVEGLAVVEWDGRGGRVLAVVDADDTAVPSALLTLDVEL